jgi:hypothetical protein
MALVPKFNGAAAAGAFYGYTPLFLTVTGTAIGAANTVASDGSIVEGAFEKAVRAIQLQASIVFISPTVADGFTVAIDGPSAGAYLTANSNTDVAAAIKAAVDAATGITSTVTAVTLAVGTTL